MKKSTYIPWATILKEFNLNYKTSPYVFSLFICHLSKTFKRLWKEDKSQNKIIKIANEFLKENNLKGVKVMVYDDGGSSTVLFSFAEVTGMSYGEKISFKNKTRADFLNWAAAKNKRKKKLQTS